MSILEIILLILLAISLVFNYRLWTLYKCYKEAWKNAVTSWQPDPISSIVNFASRVGPLVGAGVMLYFIYKRLKHEKVL